MEGAPDMPRTKQFTMILIAMTLAVLAACDKPSGLRITDYEPKAGPYMGGDPVVFKGSGFSAQGAVGAQIWFGDKPGRNVRFRGDTEMVVDSPGGQVGEVVDITIMFDDSRKKKLPQAYTYIDPQAGFGVGELTDSDKAGNTAPPPAETAQ
jgi:hypothetical protein